MTGEVGDNDVSRLGTIVGVFAHPDDETYAAAATLATAVANGQRVVCVTATRGEGTSPDDPPDLGAIRTGELGDALHIIGVTEHHWLGYRDGQCAQVDEIEGRDKVKAILDAVRPDTVLTFGPDGWTGHPDHKAVSRWTSTACAAVRSGHCRLLYVTMTPDVAARIGPAVQPAGYHSAEAPTVTPIDQVALAVTLSPDLWVVKRRAIDAHASQVTGMSAAFGPEFLTPACQAEYFRAGTPHP